MVPGRRQRHEVDEVPGVDRLLALSDGVVAIALTLLVLQLDVSHLPKDASVPELAKGLWAPVMQNEYTAYVISFYVIAQFWLAHHRVFRLVRGHHEGLAWWNFLFLFTITVMPFTSSLLGHDPSNSLAITIFDCNMLLASLSTQAVLVYGRRKGMLVPHLDIDVRRSNRLRVSGVLVVMCLSVVLAWVAPQLALYALLLLIVVPRWAQRMAQAPPKAEPGAGGLAPGSA